MLGNAQAVWLYGRDILTSTRLGGHGLGTGERLGMEAVMDKYTIHIDMTVNGNVLSDNNATDRACEALEKIAECIRLREYQPLGIDAGAWAKGVGGDINIIPNTGALRGRVDGPVFCCSNYVGGYEDDKQ